MRGARTHMATSSAPGALVSVTVDANAGETPLYTALQARLGSGHVARQRLDVGDVALRKTDGDGRAIGTVLVERKTWADLAKSLADGRWHEQKARLLSAAADDAAAEGEAAGERAEADGARGGATSVLYVVEGALRGWNGTVDGGGGSMGAVGVMRNAALEAALVMAAVRDGVPVLRTKDAAHTVDVVAYLHAKLGDGDELTSGGAALGASASSYAGLVKHKRKRDNLTPAVTWAVMLAAVPGMSARKAEAHAERMYT